MSDGALPESSIKRHSAPEMVVESVERIWSGPLPPPAVLAQYNQLLPGAADRILAMAEKQLEHRQILERNSVLAIIAAQQRGVWLGFVIALVVVVGGIAIILMGYSTVGLVAILSTLTALVGTFLYGRKHQRKELDQKKTKAKNDTL